MEKKPLHHPDYRIEGTNAFNFSRWSRENDPKPPPRFAVGDVVKFVTVARIEKVYQDCDGTALYQIDVTPYGHSGSDFELASAAEREEAGYE